MASVRFADMQSRPVEFLDFTSLTLDEFQHITTSQEAYQNHRLRNRPGPVLGEAPATGLLNDLQPRENNTDQI